MKMVIGNKNVKPGSTDEKRRDGGVKARGADPAPEKMTEVKSIRGERSKFFSDSRGRMIAEIYDHPVHYYDYYDADFKEIDARLEEKDGTLETRSNPFKARFHKNAGDGKIFEMEKDKCKVGLISRDAAKRGGCRLEKCGDGEHDSSRVLLKNVKENTDIEYIVTPKRMKENIIIRSKTDRYEFDFDLSLENIAMDVAPDGKSLELRKKDSGRKEFYIPAPYMYDAAGEKSDAVYYEAEQESLDAVKLKVIADADWINSPERVFPVTIDPIIGTAEETGGYYYDDNYESSVFRYKVFKGDKEIGGDLRLKYAEDYQDRVDCNIYVLKNRLKPYLVKNFTHVLIKLRAKAGGRFEGLCVGSGNYFAEGRDEITIDITSYFAYDDSEVEVPLRGVGRGCSFDNDVSFYPPILQIEYDNHVTNLIVTNPPKKIDYIPGEEFESAGMVVKALYDDGQLIPVTDYDFYPRKSLATYDQKFIISYDGCEIPYTGIKVNDKGFNDRRPTPGLENVYTLEEVDKSGAPERGVATKRVRLTLDDGVGNDENRAGTPLNALNLNKMKVRTENIVGKIKRINLPDCLAALCPPDEDENAGQQ